LPNANNATTCKPQQDPRAQTHSRFLFSLSSYFLNGFTMVADSGVGWAVGDRGAIERLGGDAAAGTLAPEHPPQLGGHEFGPAPAREPYQETQPAPSDASGIIPSFASQTTRDLPAPLMTSYGSPNPFADQFGGETVQQIAMSR